MATGKGVSPVGVSLGALLLAGLACSEPFVGDTGIRRFGFDMWDVHCPSGLRVLLEKDSAAKVVGIVTVVGAGSADDPPGQEGLAHFVEHLAFRARHRGGPPVWDDLSRLGASGVNAFTEFDSTTYHEYAPKDQLTALLQLESDRFSDPMEGIDQA
ncbi:MAG TPA: insulinase family protein, partial [Polyangia bacterium]|nr:insulinase family protein [Polyangia bacterium]